MNIDKIKRLIYITLCALAFVGCSQRTHDAPSSSMEPTIPVGSKVTIDYAAYNTASPARFDIVAFRPTIQPDAIFTFRVIALPGETIHITEKAVLIDGREVSPPNNLRYKPMSSGISQTNMNRSQFFLLGDNTENARDSRYFGPVEKINIIGKVTRIEPKHASNCE